MSQHWIMHADIEHDTMMARVENAGRPTKIKEVD